MKRSGAALKKTKLEIRKLEIENSKVKGVGNGVCKDRRINFSEEKFMKRSGAALKKTKLEPGKLGRCEAAWNMQPTTNNQQRANYIYIIVN